MEDGIVIFVKGEKIWMAPPEEALSLHAHAVEHMIGSGPFLIERAVPAPPHMPCSKAHPQMLYLLDPKGDPITILGAEFALPGFLFTKEDITGSEVQFAIEESAQATAWIEEAQAAVDKALDESEAFGEVVKQAEAGGCILTFGVSIGIARIIKAETKTKEPKPLVQNGAVVPGAITSKDRRLLKNLRVRFD